MNNTIKNYAGLALTLALIVVSYAFFQFAHSYGRSQEIETFSVSAESKVTAIPDIAQFSFGVLTEGGTNVGSLQQDNTKKANAIIDFVKSKGIEAKDIKTENYSITPRYTYSNCIEGRILCPPPEITGYSISQSVSVKIRDFSKISDLLGGVVERGANSVSQISFTTDDPTSLKQKAREEAIAKAKEQAKSIAKAAGFRLGRLVNVGEGNMGFPTPMPYGIGGTVAEDKAVPGPTIEPGSQEVSIQVTLTYEIK